MISVVIPHRGRDGLLIRQLYELQKQTLVDFEVIVVLDEPAPEEGFWYQNHWALHGCLDEINLPVEVFFSGGLGPATARNMGAENARSDIVLFLGSDCVPDPNLIAEHHYSYTFEAADVVQGYTPWHPDVVTPFYRFLDSSGLQAAWSNLTNENGAFKREISPAFCLTTNYSIKRQLLLNEPFNEVFTGAAWEDVELGYRLAKYNGAIKSVFNFNAINYHYHRYDLDSFVERSRMEGYHRITLCKIHPEMGWNLVNPYDIRAVIDVDEYAVLSSAKEFDDVLSSTSEELADIQARKFQRYAEACKVFSLKGTFSRINDEHPAMEALRHVHSNPQVIEVLSGVAALERGHFGYAKHCAEWFMAERSDDWSAYSFNGEVERAMGNTEEAIASFRKALTINPRAEWPKKSLGELQ